MCVCVGGTIAYLIAQTDPVVNTFTPSGISVTLAETKGTLNDDGTRSFKVVPGFTAEKDPQVTITNDVDAYLFVKVDGSTIDGSSAVGTGAWNWQSYVSWEPAEGWELLQEQLEVYVYYRVVTKDADPKTFSILKGDQIVFSDAIEADTNTSSWKLSFDAYAVQYYKNDTPAVGDNGTIVDANGTPFTAAEAWAQINASGT